MCDIGLPLKIGMWSGENSTQRGRIEEVGPKLHMPEKRKTNPPLHFSGYTAKPGQHTAILRTQSHTTGCIHCFRAIILPHTLALRYTVHANPELESTGHSIR